MLLIKREELTSSAISILVQLASVAAFACLLTVLTDRLGYRSPLNFAWILGVPAVIGWIANKGIRALMVPSLVICSWIATGITGVFLGGY